MSGILIGVCVIKHNGLIYSTPIISLAQVPQTSANLIEITFDQILDGTSIPATTAFVLSAGAVTNVAIAGMVVTLTVAPNYAYGDVITVSYTKPVLNPIKSLAGGVAVPSFIALSITNNLLPIYDGNTVAWYDYTDASTLTDDGGGLISSWRDKFLSGNNITAAGVNRPTLTATGILFDGLTSWMTGAFAYGQPETVYLVLNMIVWAGNKYFMDGGAIGDTMVFWMATASPNVYAYAGTNSPANTDLVAGSYSVVRIIFNGATSKLQVDAHAAVTGDFGAADAGGVSFGRSLGVGNYSNFEIKEAIFRSVSDNIGDETAIYNYLKTKYSL